MILAKTQEWNSDKRWKIGGKQLKLYTKYT